MNAFQIIREQIRELLRTCRLAIAEPYRFRGVAA